MSEHVDRRDYEKVTLSIPREKYIKIVAIASQQGGNVSKAWRDLDSRKDMKIEQQKRLIQVLHEAIAARDECIETLTGDLTPDVLLSVHQYTRCTKKTGPDSRTLPALAKVNATPPVPRQSNGASGLMRWGV